MNVHIIALMKLWLVVDRSEPRMVDPGRLARLFVVMPLIIAVSGAGFCSCIAPYCGPASTSRTASTSEGKSCCCCFAAERQCGMSCCQKQGPYQSDQAPSKGTNRGVFNSLVLSAALSAWNVGEAADFHRWFTAALAEMQSRLAPPTLRSQHVCLQI